MSLGAMILFVSSTLSILAVVYLFQLVRAVQSETIMEDDLPHFLHSKASPSKRGFFLSPFFRFWVKSKPTLLFYNRDRRGRFRRIKRF